MTAPKRLALNMKATPALRARIEAAAQESGLSIAQEVERRLIASFDYQDAADYLRSAFGEPQPFSLKGLTPVEDLRKRMNGVALDKSGPDA